MIDKLIAEVAKNGANACLPHNMSDELLACMDCELEAMSEGRDSEASSCVLCGLFILLSYRAGSKNVKISAEELNARLNEYRMEIAFEKVHRVSEYKYEAATLQTIFTNRELNIWREH